MRGKIAAIILSIVVGIAITIGAKADPASPVTLDDSLFQKPERLKFVQRSPNVREWRIERKKDENGHSFVLIVQLASTNNVELKSVADAEMLFPVFFKEA